MPIYRSNHGFTLIELLVVITIIGVLMVLTIQGVNMIREQGRQTQCMYNQKQIGEAILNYEGTKKRLPGVLNQTSGNIQYTWVEALFPYLDRNDMWNAVVSGGTASTAINTMTVTVTICPNDPWLIDPTSANRNALLSYGVNDQFFVNYLTNPPQDRNGTTQSPTSSSKLTSRPNASFPRGEPQSTSTTIMLGENTGDGSATYPRAGNSTYTFVGPWTSLTWPALTFHYPAITSPPAPVAISPNIMVSTHPGKVIVTFFDGHCEMVNNDALYPQ